MPQKKTTAAIPRVSPDSITSHLLQTSKAPTSKSLRQEVKRDYLRNLQESPLSSHLAVSYTKKDIDDALSAIKNGKAAGGDEIFPEFLKNLGEKSRTSLAALFTAIHEQGKFLQPGKMLMLLQT